MFELIFSSQYDIYFYSTLEDIFTVVMLYSFLKLVLLSSVIELLWPTQFFNKRNVFTISTQRLRGYNEFFPKLMYNNVSFPKTITSINF